MLIGEASAQAAEATKAATQAADVFLDRGVLGAACVLLILAVCVLFWLLIRALNRNADLVDRVATIAEGSKAATEKTASALGGLESALEAATGAVQDLAREAEGEAREVRHGLANLSTVVTSLTDGLRRLRRGEDA